ncbi:MAG: LysM domain-containing protein [Verrucomicrobiota bacterium]
MDTISRENNSMLPVGGIIVGVIALLLGGYSAITLAKVNRTLAEQQTKIDKIDSLESSVTTAADNGTKAIRFGETLQRSMQDAFNQVGPELGNLSGRITKLEEMAKKPAPAPTAADSKGGKKSGPVEAGPGEYVIKSGDTFAKIARAQNVALADIQAVNPGVNSSSLKVGQKIKLPKK